MIKFCKGLCNNHAKEGEASPLPWTGISVEADLARSGSEPMGNNQPTQLSHFLRHVKHALIGMIGLLLAVYVGDYVVVRIRIAKQLAPYGMVQVQRSYAVAMKNGKPEYFFEPPADQPCINALFPHFGYTPCWFLRRRKVQQIKM